MNHLEYITDTKGKKQKVVLPVKEYNALHEKLEDLEDTIAADKILNEPQVKYISLEEFLARTKVK